MTPAGAAGTAADHYRTRTPDHRYRAGATDPGQRPYCVVCGLERHAVPTPLIPVQRDGRRAR